ncbi:hypothetical protein SAMN05421748_1011119 [Paractinoplanes atraurantiacus]|uniref:Uncharacterized protein n=1 Tax=Paractinoplanes atraurantiacus TaxID=1036182 RepID=A0A285FSC6_9ACTN|nr:hypothetical protein SAMN05421748_1011119 [Actinoplanes atraurantiacus]
MVSINDYYLNASARDHSGLRYDHENDDPAERTPGRLPDGLTVRRISRGASRSTPAPRVEPSRRRTLAGAISKLQASTPGIGSKGLVRRLREQGWPDVTKSEVEAIIPAPPGPALHGTPPTTKRPAIPQSPTISTRKTSSQAEKERRAKLVAEIDRLRARHRGIGAVRLTEELRAKGWRDVSVDQVRAIVTPAPAKRKPAPNAVTRPVPQPPSSRARRVGARSPSWELAAVPRRAGRGLCGGSRRAGGRTSGRRTGRLTGRRGPRGRRRRRRGRVWAVRRSAGRRARSTRGPACGP